MQTSIKFTVITGATGYLGRAFALECACRGENLFLTGRSEQKLQELQTYLLSVCSDVCVRYFACDLTVSEEREKLFDYFDKLTFSDFDGARVSKLINVAGADIQKAFESYDQQKLTFQTRICFEAAVALSNFAIKRRADRLQIINISSVSGIYPMPYFALYSACKRALTNFSVALNQEMKGTGVTSTAILPGAIYTRADVVEYIKTQGLWGKIAAKQPEFVVKKSLKAADKGKAKTIIGFANKLMNVFTKLIPQRIKLKFIAAKWKKTTKDAF
jgi:hypothetical protein